MNALQRAGWAGIGFVAGYLVGRRKKAQQREVESNKKVLVPMPLVDEWGVIGQRYSRFVGILSDLLLSLGGLIDRTVQTTTPADRLVFVLAHVATEDFLQILFLCRHGFGIGGFQILRSLYERTVTMVYISRNPDQADEFFAYHAINQGKALNHAKDLGQVNLLGLSPQQIKDIEQEYRDSKPRFQEILCENCGTKRTRISWSTMDLASMAHHADKGLRDLYVSLYLMPTLHAHATVPSVLSRMELTMDGHFRYKTLAQIEHVGAALIGGHNAIIRVFNTVNEHFGLKLDGELEKLIADFKKAWPEAPN